MDPVVQILLQSGVAGLVAVIAGFVIKSLFTRMQEDHDQELARLADRAVVAEQRADRLESELSRLNGAIQNGYTNTLVQASQAISDANRTVVDVLAAVRRR